MDKNFQPDEKLEYIGSGFIGYDIKDKEMIFLKRDPNYPRDIFVTYKGKGMSVRDDEVKKSRPSN